MSATTSTSKAPPATRPRKKRTSAHYIVMTLWFVLALWLCVPIAVAVIGDTFFGDGPLDGPQAESPAITAPPSPTPPGP